MSERRGNWQELERPGPGVVEVAGVELRRGSRVRLHPRGGGDVFDLVLEGKTGQVESIEQDTDGAIQLSITVDDDPGRDLGFARRPGHRFFFAPAEVQPLPEPAPVASASARTLVAGIGNIFLGDDGFGVEVARRLAGRELPAGVEVGDFGIRGLDLVYALGEGYDAAILVDAVPRGERPGTLFVIEPEITPEHVGVDAHGMDPLKVLTLAAELGTVPSRVLIVGCEPAVRLSGDSEEIVGELSEAVRAAIEPATRLVESLVDDIANGNPNGKEARGP